MGTESLFMVSEEVLESSSSKLGDTGGVGRGFRGTCIEPFSFDEDESWRRSRDSLSSVSIMASSSGASTCKKYSELATSCALTTFSFGFSGVRNTSG